MALQRNVARGARVASQQRLWRMIIIHYYSRARPGNYTLTNWIWFYRVVCAAPLRAANHNYPLIKSTNTRRAEREGKRRALLRPWAKSVAATTLGYNMTRKATKTHNKLFIAHTWSEREKDFDQKVLHCTLARSRELISWLFPAEKINKLILALPMFYQLFWLFATFKNMFVVGLLYSRTLLRIIGKA